MTYGHSTSGYWEFAPFGDGGRENGRKKENGGKKKTAGKKNWREEKNGRKKKLAGRRKPMEQSID